MVASPASTEMVLRAQEEAVTAKPDGSDIDERGLKLGRKLGGGGQGTVIEVVSPYAGLVFKRYNKLDADVAALKQLVDMPAALPPLERDRLHKQTAWPRRQPTQIPHRPRRPRRSRTGPSAHRSSRALRIEGC